MEYIFVFLSCSQKPKTLEKLRIDLWTFSNVLLDVPTTLLTKYREWNQSLNFLDVVRSFTLVDNLARFVFKAPMKYCKDTKLRKQAKALQPGVVSQPPE